MNLFNLSSAQKMLLFSEINNPNNDSFYLKFRKDYDLKDFEYVNAAIESISKEYLTLQIRYDENGDFKQYYADVSDVNVETFDVSDDDLDGFIEDYLDNPFEDIFDSPLYKWAVLKTKSSAVLIGVVQHILLDGTSLYSIAPQEIEKCMNCIKNDEEYIPIDYSYEDYVDAEIDYLNSQEANSDKQYWMDTLNDYSQDWYSFDDSHLGFLEVILDEIPKFDYSPFVTSLALSFLYFAKSKKDNKSFNDLILNTSVHGRYFGQEDALGMFVNTIPLRLAYDEELTFDELLAYSKGVLKEGLGHAKLQFSEYTTDLRNVGIDPDCISMISIVSNSTDHDSKFLTLQKDIKFPLHFRINKNYSDKDGLQSIFIEYDKACFTRQEIESMATGLRDLIGQVIADSSKKCKDYDLDVANFFKAENYYNNLINSFAYPTTISPDTNDIQSNFETIYQSFSLEKLKKLSEMYGIRNQEMLLSIFLYNLTKFSFSKDILVAYNSQATGYHFNTDLSVKQYLDDFINGFKEFNDYPLANNKKLNFESEILFDNQNSDYENYKLIFSVENNYLNLTYDSSYYSPKLIESFLTAFNVLIDKFAKSDDLLKDISILKDIDCDEGFEIALKNDGVISKVFEDAVAQNPDKCILYADDGEFTYSQLNKKANRIANALIKKGLKLEDRVMFIMKRNSDLIAAVLGIIKAGGAFIPIDPKYPKNRIEQILEDSDSKFVIINDEIEFDIENTVRVSELLEESDDSNPDVDITPDNLCFLIYTSGSTGKPKGVMITHRGISNYIAYDERNVPIYELNNKCEKFVSISTVSFIVFLREIFGTIMNGLPVVFANDEQSIDPFKLSELFMKTDADGFGSTPTRLLEYLRLTEIQEVLEKCKVLIVGGEAFPPVLYDKLSEFTDADIYNSYGPTEVTIASHYKLIDSNVISAGWRMLNVVDKIMDIDGNQLPPHVPGEIYVGGAGIARGYLNNPEQTEKVFLTLNDIPYYNTGDLGKKDEHGELYTLGRNDTQIKLRGLRIELSEIEGAIANYGDVMLTKVMVKTINSIEHLCAYYTAGSEIDSDELNKYLENNLPDYMVPSYYTQLDEFPKTPNGKTDFKNLPDPKVDVEKFIEPEGDIEKGIYDVICEILGITDFGVNTDLFKIGLTSLSVIKLSSSLFKKFNSELSIVELIDAKNIRNISKLIEAQDTSQKIVMEDNYELTPNQLGVYFDCIKNPEKIGYNLPKKIVLDKDIDSDKLRKSILKAIDLHPYLKNRIVINEGKVFNHPSFEMNVDEIEIEKISELTAEILDDFIKPFEIVDSQLFRFKIYETDSNVVLLADFHHLIVDGTSLNILFNDIAAIYDDDKDRLVEVEADAYEFISNENNSQLSDLSGESEAFFDEMMSDFDEGTILTTNLTGDDENAQLANIKLGLDKDLLESFCNDMKISPNILFMSATALTLTKYVSNKDILISTIFNGRDNYKYQNTIGMLVKTLPIAFKTDRDMNIQDYFEFVSKSWLDVLNNSSFNYVEVANKYNVYPDFLYAFHGKIIEDINIGGKTYPRESMDYDSLRFKLALNVIEINDEFVISIDYNDAIYSKDYIDTFAESIKNIINQFMDKKDELVELRLRDIAIVPEDGGAEFTEVETKLLYELFEKNVEENPDKIALISCDGQLTYDELNRKANRVAHALINRGVKSGSKILHMLPRTSDLIVAMFGIVKAGCAFVPLANDYPEERVNYIFENSDADYVISDFSLENAVSVSTLLDESDDETNPKVDISPDDLAYMIYTSGSTGNPKGVMITNENITNLFANTDENYVYNVYHTVESMLSITTVSFDASMIEVLGCFVNGRTLIFADDNQTKDIFELVELIERTHPDYMGFTPSRLLQYMEFDGFKQALHSFKAIKVGGEKFPKELLELLSEYDIDVYNSYGPTETTVQSNLKHMKFDEEISVGGSLFNYITDVRDIDDKLLPDGVMGELYIGGQAVTKGYYKNPEKTDEVYLSINGIKYYKSGDYAIKRNGEIYVQGRMDNQIKLRGLRIEPEEISSVISTFDGITNVVVVIKKINNVDHLCAYYSGNDEIVVDDLKEYISSRLTDYMVPTVFMQLEKLPQTPNGKTDIKNLPEPELTTEYVAPENDVEAFFANCFQEVLGIDKVGVTDNFFEIGGNSLLVTKITIESINKGYDVNYGDVFDNPTPRELADCVLSDKKSTTTYEDDYDYTLIDNLLKKNNPKSFLAGERDESLGNVLLTGATGFLGIHVLHELLDSEMGDIYCFVRSKGNLTAEKRLKSLLFYYFASDMSEFDSRLHVVDGDITDFEDFKKLIPYDINTIINCAANVKHFSSGTDIEDINLGGVINGLEFAKLKDAKYVQISTVSVAGESVNNYPPSDRIFSEQDLFIGQRVDNQYLGSKFLAERQVLEAAAEDGLDVKIMRVGNLMARNSDSEFQINFESNGFINRIKSFITIGKFPVSMLNNNVEFSPIDYTAKSIVSLSKAPKECRVFHPCNNHKISFADVIDILKDLEFDIDVVGEDEFEAALAEVMKDEEKQAGLEGFITSIGSGQVKKVWVKDTNDYTIQMSYLMGVKWPLISDEYVYNFMKFMKDSDFF
ncbi:amino acid adenylation domain-containing protein [Methanobrevibacter sp.]|uniref:amino acid adenylation domain-containing protein n=1 Tax=Methanobrevibacter sp. TaxID=66852 RepID=UPI00389046F9